MTEIEKTDAQWREELSKEEYLVCRQKGTEQAFTGKYYNTKSAGIYCCTGCAAELFDSETKYDSGSGWPSFYQPIDDNCIQENTDQSMGMTRTEVVCSKCGSHLGHRFDDGPQPTGQRYCINSVSLKLSKS